MKIKTVKEVIRNNNTFYKYYVNDIHIVTCRKYKDWFCTVKNGTRSNLRDKVKSASNTNWKPNNLMPLLTELTKKPINRTLYDQLFKDDYPDTSWGYPGRAVGPKKIKLLIEEYVRQETSTFI